MFSNGVSNSNPSNFQFHHSRDEHERPGENERKEEIVTSTHQWTAGEEDEEDEEAAAEEEANYPCGEPERGEVAHQGCLFWAR